MVVIGNDGSRYDVVIGLEVHAQISTEAKLFSRSKREFGMTENTNVSLMDVAMPGVLPVLNMEAIEKAVIFGLAVGGKINLTSRFDRKHYSYPDLPLGYQITQNYKPLVEQATLTIETSENTKKRIRINRIHIETDAGKLIHDRIPNKSCVDFNRVGIPLMEIVTEPDLTGADDTVKYLKELHRLLRFVDASDADMEKGSFRCDVNISLRPEGSVQLGTRCEIKNVNSFRFVAMAIEFEAKRQADILSMGGSIAQETRLFDSNTGETRTMREKIDALDYHYFPDPDLSPVYLTEQFVKECASRIPELPQAKYDRYITQSGLLPKEAGDLVANTMYCQYFDFLVTSGHESKFAFGWIMSELVGRLNKINISIENSKVDKEALKALLDEQKAGTISGKMAKEVLDEMVFTGQMPSEIIIKKGFVQIDNSSELEKAMIEVMASNKAKVEEYRGGRTKLIGFFVGQVMQKTSGMANPQKVNEIALKLLESDT